MEKLFTVMEEKTWDKYETPREYHFNMIKNYFRKEFYLYMDDEWISSDNTQYEEIKNYFDDLL